MHRWSLKNEKFKNFKKIYNNNSKKQYYLQHQHQHNIKDNQKEQLKQNTTWTNKQMATIKEVNAAFWHCQTRLIKRLDFWNNWYTDTSLATMIWNYCYISTYMKSIMLSFSNQNTCYGCIYGKNFKWFVTYKYKYFYIVYWFNYILFT